MAGGSGQGIILTARDRHLLAELQVLRIVDREQAALFAPFTSTTRANARLLALTRARFLKRTFIGTIKGGRKALYSLPGTRRANPAHENAIAHQLAVNQLYYAFKYPPPLNPAVQFAEWHQASTILSSHAPLIPDGIVRVQSPHGQQTFCVEVDLGTEALGVWDAKIERYLQLARSGEHRAVLEADRFGVLVVVDGARRMENIRAHIRSRTDKLFWLATTENIRTHSVWAPMWLRPSLAEPCTLVG